MGSWAVMNQAELAVYGGAQTAVQAVVAPSTSTVPAVNGLGLLAYAPQLGSAIGNQTTVMAATADPLLRGATPKITPLWFDLPDMSTPLVSTYASNPIQQADLLSAVLAKPSVVNDYAAAGDGAAVPMETDWVVSQPTRRYHAAMDYLTPSGAAAVLFNVDMTNHASAVSTTTNNRYAALTKSVTTHGPDGLPDRHPGRRRPRRRPPAGISAPTSPGRSPPPGVLRRGVHPCRSLAATSQVMQAQVANTWYRRPAGATGLGAQRLAPGRRQSACAIGLRHVDQERHDARQLRPDPDSAPLVIQPSDPIRRHRIGKFQAEQSRPFHWRRCCLFHGVVTCDTPRARCAPGGGCDGPAPE